MASPTDNKIVDKGCYIGDQGLAAVGEQCKQLEDLNLRFCEGLTDTGVIAIAVGCGRTLRALGIGACANITDSALEAVGAHCHYIEKLTLDSDYIRNAGVLAIAQGCCSLKCLRLQCVNVTDEALQSVGGFCLSLETLALHSFQKFTDRYRLAALLRSHERQFDFMVLLVVLCCLSALATNLKSKVKCFDVESICPFLLPRCIN